MTDKREQEAELSDEVRTELLQRLRRIEGQAQGVQRMIQEGRECHAILDQLNSIRAATYGASLALMKHYALGCMRRPDEEKPPEKAVEDMVDMLLRLRP